MEIYPVSSCKSRLKVRLSRTSICTVPVSPQGREIQRKGAKLERREEEIGTADSAHETVSLGLGSILAFFPLRLRGSATLRSISIAWLRNEPSTAEYLEGEAATKGSDQVFH
jgi:hypothetical protein